MSLLPFPAQEQPERLAGTVKWFNSTKGESLTVACAVQAVLAARPGESSLNSLGCLSRSQVLASSH